MSVPALRESAPSTLPEESGWFQPQPLATRDIGLVGNTFKSQIKRELVLDRDSDSTTAALASAPATGTMPAAESLARRINQAVHRTIPRSLPTPVLSLQPLQEWEGYVVEIESKKFWARLVDRTTGGKVEEELAEFPIGDVSDEDRNLLTVGSVFRWVIGYQRARGGSKRRVSQVTFRRMPAWSPNELKDAEKTAKKFVETIIWD
jgi:hypothetical protein